MRKPKIKTLLLGLGLPTVAVTIFNFYIHPYPVEILFGIAALLISFLALFLLSDWIKNIIGLAHQYQYTIYTIAVLGITFFLYHSNEEISKLNTLGDILGLCFLMVSNGFLYVEGKMGEE